MPQSRQACCSMRRRGSGTPEATPPTPGSHENRVYTDDIQGEIRKGVPGCTVHLPRPGEPDGAAARQSGGLTRAYFLAALRECGRLPHVFVPAGQPTRRSMSAAANRTSVSQMNQLRMWALAGYCPHSLLLYKMALPCEAGGRCFGAKTCLIKRFTLLLPFC